MFRKDMTTSMSYLWDPNRILLSRRVDRLSAEEECWYRRALDFSWIDEGLSIDPAETADRIRKNCTVEAAQKLLDEFFIVDKKNPRKMVNEKQEELRKKLKKKLRNLSNAGKRSGQKRRENKDLSAEQMLNKSGTKAEQMSGNKDNVIKGNKDKEKKNVAEAAPVSEPSGHTLLMRHHADRIETITDGAAQGKAVKNILAKFSVVDAIGCYNYQVQELSSNGGWRSSVSWQTVFGFIAEWVTAGRPKEPPKKNGTNQQHHKRTPGEIIAGREYR